jgi:hypothetical protein
LFIPDPDPDFYPSRIPDPGVKKAPNPGFWIWILNTRIYHHAKYPNLILEEQLNLSQQKLAEETARAERLELLLKPDPLG